MIEGMSTTRYARTYGEILIYRLTDWAEDNSYLPESQFGFRTNRRTIDCIFILNAMIENSLNNRKSLYVCYVDFKKAFDNINHRLLWKKLVNMKISQQMLEMLQSIYSNAKSCLKLTSNSVSDLFPCQKGVRQVCNLSHLLFNLFMADLQKELRKNKSGVEIYDENIFGLTDVC